MVRYAAGVYWIIKLNQQGEYVDPVSTNESGAFLWNALEEGAGAKELADLLEERYGIGPEDAKLDVNSFLEQFIGTNLEAYVRGKGVFL